MPQPGSLKRCPYCRERIPVAATRCRYCREILDDDDDAEPVPRQSTAIQEKPSSVPRPRPRLVEEEDDNGERRPRGRQDEEDNEDEEERPRRRRRSRRGAYAECPNCGSPGRAKRVSFTWWGGLLGPALFSHVRCRDCDTCYNGKTGNYNTSAITIYLVIGGVLGIGLMIGVILTAMSK